VVSAIINTKFVELEGIKKTLVTTTTTISDDIPCLLINQDAKA